MGQCADGQCPECVAYRRNQRYRKAILGTQIRLNPLIIVPFKDDKPPLRPTREPFPVHFNVVMDRMRAIERLNKFIFG